MQPNAAQATTCNQGDRMHSMQVHATTVTACKQCNYMYWPCSSYDRVCTHCLIICGQGLLSVHIVCTQGKHMQPRQLPAAKAKTCNQGNHLQPHAATAITCGQGRHMQPKQPHATSSITYCLTAYNQWLVAASDCGLVIDT